MDPVRFARGKKVCDKKTEGWAQMQNVMWKAQIQNLPKQLAPKMFKKSFKNLICDKINKDKSTYQRVLF